MIFGNFLAESISSGIWHEAKYHEDLDPTITHKTTFGPHHIETIFEPDPDEEKGHYHVSFKVNNSFQKQDIPSMNAVHILKHISNITRQFVKRYPDNVRKLSFKGLEQTKSGASSFHSADAMKKNDVYKSMSKRFIPDHKISNGYDGSTILNLEQIQESEFLFESEVMKNKYGDVTHKALIDDIPYKVSYQKRNGGFDSEGQMIISRAKDYAVSFTRNEGIDRRGVGKLSSEHRTKAAAFIMGSLKKTIQDEQPDSLKADGNTQSKVKLYRKVFDHLAKKYGGKSHHVGNTSYLKFEKSKLEETWKLDQFSGIHKKDLDGHKVSIDAEMVGPGKVKFDFGVNGSISKIHNANPSTSMKILKHVNDRIDSYVRHVQPHQVHMQSDNPVKDKLYCKFASRLAKKHNGIYSSQGESGTNKLGETFRPTHVVTFPGHHKE